MNVKSWYRGGLFGIALGVVAAQGAAAQFVSPRVAIGFAGEWRPTLQAGVEARGELGDGSSRVDSLGVTHRRPPSWLWSFLALGGISSTREGHADARLRPTAQGQVGVLYRATGAMRAGMYGVGLVEPRALGIVARFEPMSAAGVQAGWLRRPRSRSNAVLVQVDVAMALLTDLFHGGGR